MTKGHSALSGGTLISTGLHSSLCPFSIRPRPGANEKHRRAVAFVFPMFRWWLALIFLPCASPVAAQNVADSICLTNAQQVRELKPDDAAKNIPARLRGVVTY